MDKRVLPFLPLIILLASLLVPTAGWGQAERLVTLKVGTVPIANLVPLYAAVHKGFMAEEGLKVEIVPMAGGAWIIPAIAGGSVDIGLVNITSHILAVNQGFDIKMVAPPYHEQCTRRPGAPGSGLVGQAAIITRPDSGITSAKDLEGRKVGTVGLKSIDWFLVSEWMKKNGANPDKVIWVESGFPRMGSILASKEVDAVQVTEPFKSIIAAQGGKVLDHTFCAVKESLTVAYFAARVPWIEKNPDLLQRFVRAYKKAVRFVRDNFDDRVDIVTKYTRVEADLARKMVWTDWKEKADLADLQWWIDLVHGYNLLKRRLDAKELVHDSAL